MCQGWLELKLRNGKDKIIVRFAKKFGLDVNGREPL